MRKHLWLLCVVGCAGDAPPQPPPANLHARVQIDASGLRITQLGGPAAMTPYAAPNAQPLQYSFVDASGAVLASGEVPDPRLARFEAFDPQPAWVVANVGTGAATVPLPAQRGTLIVRDATGELGRVAFDPDAPVPAPLLAMPDVVGKTKIVDHGPAAGRLNLAILAEGYTDAQLDTYRQAVANFVGELQQTDGFAQHWSQINIWRIDVRSEDAGAGAGGIPRRTAFDTAYDTGGIHRLLAMETQGARDAATQLRQSVQADAAIALVNSSDYGGSGDGGDVVSVIYAGDAGDGHGIASISAHELGHAIWHLADEYEDAALCDPAHPFAAPNIAPAPVLAALPWQALVAPGTALPTTVDDATTVGAYEGAAYCATGRFRPQHDCRMRDLGHRYCAACLSQIDQYFAKLAPPDQVPGAPTGLSPDQQVTPSSAVTLGWSAVSDATSYWLLLGHWASDGTWLVDYEGNLGAATAANASLAGETSYAFAVDACDAAGCGAWSSYASFATP